MKTRKDLLILAAKSLGAVAFVALFLLNISLFVKKDSTGRLMATALNANADPEATPPQPAVCLTIHVQEAGKHAVDTGKHCFADAPGPDVYEGKLYNCESFTAESKCNKTTCASDPNCHG